MSDATLFRSFDRGETFESIAEPFKNAHGSYPLVTQIRAEPGRLMVDVGGAVLASRNKGDTWTVVFPGGGTVPPLTPETGCLTMFAIAGDRMTLGSADCIFWDPEVTPSAKLTSGWLIPEEDGWRFTQERVASPSHWVSVSAIHVLNDQTIFVSRTSIDFVRSDDGGVSFVTLLPKEGHFGSPRITQLAPVPGHAEVIIGGGGPYWMSLYCSYDTGWNWTDCSGMAFDMGFSWRSTVSLIARDRRDNLLIVIRDYDAVRELEKYSILKLNARDTVPRRRSVLR